MFFPLFSYFMSKTKVLSFFYYNRAVEGRIIDYFDIYAPGPGTSTKTLF